MMGVLQKELEDNAPATAQKNINLKILNAVEMNIPPVTEQTEIVRILDDLLAKKPSSPAPSAANWVPTTPARRARYHFCVEMSRLL